MGFSWNGRPQQVVVTAFTEDRRILQQWYVDLAIGQRISIPQEARTIQVDAPETITRTRVVLGPKPRRPRTTPRLPR